MQPDRSEYRLELADVDDERLLASLARIDAMSDEELRDLVRHEDPIVVEAAEAIIARRRSAQREAI